MRSDARKRAANSGDTLDGASDSGIGAPPAGTGEALTDAEHNEHSELVYTEEAVERIVADRLAAEGCGHPNHGSEDHDCTPFRAAEGDLRARIEALATRYERWPSSQSLAVTAKDLRAALSQPTTDGDGVTTDTATEGK